MSTQITPAVRIDSDRLWADLMALGDITEPDRPYTRQSFTPMFAIGRAFLRERFEAYGAQVTVDAAGNLVARLEGRDPDAGTIAIGSHSDTVPSGGRFDGVAGVVAGLEVLRAIAESGWQHRHAIEIIDFLAEEPSEFGLSCIGSRGIIGQLGDDMLAMTDPAGRVLGDVIGEVGGNVAALPVAMRSDISAFLELHIEQGPVLEDRGAAIGVVGTIVAIRRIEILFEGRAAHAGTTPMDLRRDAAVAGAATLLKVRELAEFFAASDEHYFVATVGIVEVRPGGSNVVPRDCRLVIDARSDRPDIIDRFEAAMERESVAAASNARVERASFEVLSDGVPAQCAAELQQYIRTSADELGYAWLDMPSGAGHDAAFMARICPAAMIFIPCLGGHSHTPVEWSDQGQVAAGTQVLLRVVERIDAAAG